MAEQEYPWETRHSPKGAGRKRERPVRPAPSQVRLPCGHYSDRGECQDPECESGSPDPWDLADDPNAFHRYEETRAYRQSVRR